MPRIEELEELSQLAKEKHLFLFEAISTQYLPNVLKIKEKLNELGNIKIVTATTHNIHLDIMHLKKELFNLLLIIQNQGEP